MSRDDELIEELNQKISREKQTPASGLFLAAQYYWLIDEFDKARDYAKKAMEVQKDISTVSLLGWIDLTCGRDSLARKSLEYFENATAMGGKKEVDVNLIVELTKISGHAWKSQVLRIF